MAQCPQRTVRSGAVGRAWRSPGFRGGPGASDAASGTPSQPFTPTLPRAWRQDWIHHVPVYILNTLMFSVRAGDVILLQALVMTGIPGGVDYLLPVVEGDGAGEGGDGAEGAA